MMMIMMMMIMMAMKMMMMIVMMIMMMMMMMTMIIIMIVMKMMMMMMLALMDLSREVTRLWGLDRSTVTITAAVGRVLSVIPISIKRGSTRSPPIYASLSGVRQLNCVNLV